MDEKSVHERYGSEVLGERLAWARNQQGMTLEDVHAKTGLAIGYICQLEGGSKRNPSLSSLILLAKALCVPLSFLVGEVSEPRTHGSGGAIARAFAAHLQSLPRERQAAVQLMSVEQRFAMVVAFLCERYPQRFTRATIAFQTGLTVRALNDILEQSWELKAFTLVQFAQLTGLGLPFFGTGDLPQPQAELSTNDLLRYASVIRLAAKHQVEPSDLERFIRGGRGLAG